jgi:mannose/fructose/N-acetylgalactosamine-specific phosphotransferase system component IIC
MNIFFLSALISFLSLDVTIAFQVLISSPIFTGPLIGWLLGDVWLGFELGFLWQLIWLGRIPAGAYIVPEGNIASMIATTLILLYRDIDFPNTLLTVVFFEVILVSYLGAIITYIYRKINGKILDFMLKFLNKINFKFVIILEGGSIFIYFVIIFFMTLAVILINQNFLPDIVQFIGKLFEKQLVVIKPLIMGIGLGLVFPIFFDVVKNK